MKNFGFIVTSIWIVSIFLFWFLGDLKKPTSLNELGDFLAGAFAPIAFLWLVLGYRQQGKQLEQNTKALEQQEKALQLQIEEMRDNVRQQVELVKIQKQELNNNYLINKPSIICKVIEGKLINKPIADGHLFHLNLKIFLKNDGRAEATSIEIKSENNYLDFVRKLSPEQENEVTLIFREGGLTLKKQYLYTHFNVTYLDVYEKKHVQNFEVKGTLMNESVDNPEWEIHIFTCEKF